MSDDAELRLKLTELGVDVGPITHSTRELYRRMLRKRTNELQASNLGSAAKKHKPAPSPSAPKIPKKKPVSTKPRSNGPAGTPKIQKPVAGKKEGGASRPAGVNVTPYLSPQVPSAPPSPYDRPVPPSPSLYPKLPPLSSDLLPPFSSSSSSSIPQHNYSHSSSDDQHGSPPLPVPFNKQRSNSGSDGHGMPPPSHSPPPPSSPNSTDSSGVVTTITNWLGARVKNIIGHLQDVTSPSPRRPLARTPSAASPSPSAPTQASPSGQRSFVSEDSISVDELDFFDGPGDIYLHVPAPRDGRQPRGSKRHSGTGGERYDWELEPSDVEICKEANGKLCLLGRGGCGQVYRGLKDRVDDVAVKVIRLQGTDSRSAVAQFKQEIDMICKLRHRHIVQFYGACVQPSCLFMVTELMDTDLFSTLRMGSKYTWDGDYGQEVLTGIASGLNYLHSRRPPIVHRDIKSPNILVMNGLAKIADVGIANTMAATDMTAQRGFTVAWAAPEVILRKRANEKIDIWGFGIILWEVVTGSIPRPGQLVFPPRAPSHLRSLYMKCTSDAANNRPTAADIIHALKEGVLLAERSAKN